MTKKQTNVFKGVAIILMFVHHLFGDAGVLKDMNVHPFVPQNILLMIASAGKVCVAIFVFASAYGITKQQEKSGDSNLAGRIIKIWMPFFFIYIFAAIAAVVTGNWKATYGKAWQSNLYFAVIDALGLANLFGTPTLNGTWWYMSLALILPFIIYAAIKIYDKFGAIGTIVLGIFIPGCLGVTDTDSYRWWMLTVVLGVLLAKTKFFEKLSKKYNDKGFSKVRIQGWGDPVDTAGFKKEWFIDTDKIWFEDAWFTCPKDTEGFLEHSFGKDYMTLPPEESRKPRHTATSISFPEE